MDTDFQIIKILKDMPNKNTVHQILKELELPELAEQISLNFQDEKKPILG